MEKVKYDYMHKLPIISLFGLSRKNELMEYIDLLRKNHDKLESSYNKLLEQLKNKDKLSGNQ